jgi:hypothetical protein
VLDLGRCSCRVWTVGGGGRRSSEERRWKPKPIRASESREYSHDVPGPVSRDHGSWNRSE